MSVETVISASPVRLVDYAKAHLVSVPIDDVGELIKCGALRINDRPGRIAELVHSGDILGLDDTALGATALLPQHVPIVIHHEDDAVLVCDKPAGMHVHPLGPHREDTLLNALLWHCGA